MQNDFYQQKLFEQRRFTFTNDGLHVRYKKFFKLHEYELKYEDIGTRLIQSSKGIRRWLIFSLIFLVISVTLFIDRLYGGEVEKGAELFYMVPAIACGMVYALTYNRSCFLVKPNNKNPIEFLYNRPSKSKLEDFIKEIKHRRKECLINRYGQFNAKLGYEHQYNNLAWLLEIDVISQTEFDVKLALLDKSVPSTNTVKGFTFGEN